MIICVASAAVALTPRQVPDVQRADASRWVSDPSGLLSPDALSQADAELDRLNRENTTEVCAVVVPDLSGEDIDDFATELFELWGIGRKDTDNGLLLLISTGDRRAAIRTGDGMEIAMTDGRAGQIIRHVIVPAMKDNQLDSALLGSIAAIGQVVEDPAYFDDLHSDIDAVRRPKASSGGNENFFRNYLILAVVASVAMLALIVTRLVKTRRLDTLERYGRLDRLRLASLMLVALTLGIGIIPFIVLWLALRHIRLRRHNCPNCGTRMHRVDEVHDNDYLTPAQDMEEQLNSVDYDVWLCPNCNETDIIPYANRRSAYTQCPACGARAESLEANRILRQPTTRAEGIGVRQYRCRNCGNLRSVPYQIAKLAAAPPVIIGGGGFGRGGGFGGGGFGGGFGGGTTSGGGASGGW